MKTRNKSSGFFIVEVLIVLVLVALLTLILLPNFQVYTERAKFADVIRAAEAAKPAVEVCFLRTGGVLTDCNTVGKLGITQTTTNRGNLLSGQPTITASNAAINAEAIPTVGSGATYILIPTYNTTDKTITWDSPNTTDGGTCHALGLC